MSSRRIIKLSDLDEKQLENYRVEREAYTKELNNNREKEKKGFDFSSSTTAIPIAPISNKEGNKFNPTVMSGSNMREIHKPIAKLPMKIASQEEIKKTKELDVNAYNKMQEEVENKQYGKYFIDKAKLELEGLGSSIKNMYITDHAKNVEKTKKINDLIGQDNSKANKEVNNLIALEDDSYYHKKRGMELKEKELPDTVKTIGDTVGAGASMAAKMAAYMINPVLGSSLTYADASGKASKEALDDGATIEEAYNTGVGKGLVEATLDKFVGGQKFIRGVADKYFKKNVLSKTSNQVTRFLTSKGYEIGGEIVEENLTDGAGYLIDKIVRDKDLPNLEEALNNAKETTKMTFLTTLAFNLIGLGGSTYNNSRTTTDMENMIGKQLTETERSKVNGIINETKQLVQNKKQNAGITTQNEVRDQTNTINSQSTKLQIRPPQNIEQSNPIAPMTREVREKLGQNSSISNIQNVAQSGNMEPIRPITMSSEKINSLKEQGIQNTHKGVNINQVTMPVKSISQFSTDNIKKLVNEQGKTNAIKIIREAYKNKYKDAVVNNSEVGKIIIGKNGIKNTFGHGIYTDKMAVLDDLSDLLANSTIKNISKDAKGRDNTWRYLAQDVNIDGIIKEFVADIKKSNGNTNFYNHNINKKDDPVRNRRR